MRFIHLADVHLGGWRDQKMSSLAQQAFKESLDFALLHQVDFVLIAGDLFNTALPNIEYIKNAVGELMRLKLAGIPVYIIPGSHDYSPSGKTMLDVFECVGLIINVV